MLFPTHRQALVVPGQGVRFVSPMANAWGRSFLRHLSAELMPVPHDEAQLWVCRIVPPAQALFDARMHAPTDMAVCTVLGVSALMVSAYQITGVELGRADRALALVERAFVLTYRAYIRNVCLPLLQGGELQAAELARMNFHAWGRPLPPSAQGHRDPRGAVRGPEWPGFQCFFEEHGAPELARIMQTADETWIRALADHRRAGSEPGSRACGESSDFSPFHFSHARVRPAPRRRDTVLELDLGTSAAWGDALDERRPRGSVSSASA
ncbi:MAG: hypothetical protein O9318_15470 [Hylemonella sp.]|uniref:hypothetical protein n=1 Tax=Hylemonella sp. TaxID=2066020 RepID=UPI0022C258CA|nr:hypothetical protein [Hylemonella sp.]MCZ8253864.1 hypothetical protein [Hylemonella sp.]